jgi:uncharacterized protein (TIGR02302 family)
MAQNQMEQQWFKPDIRKTPQYRVAAVSLFVGRLWHSSVALFCVIIGFLALSLLGIWQAVNLTLHVVLLVSFGLLIGAAIYRLFRLFKIPDDAAIRTALEHKSDLSHRPFREWDADLIDNGSTSSQTTQLWEQHQQKQLALLDHLAYVWPDLSLGRGDHFSVRAVAVLAVIVGIGVAGIDGPRRVSAAFDISLSGSPQIVDVDLWIAPPDYTGGAPRLLAQGDMSVAAKNPVQQFRVPEGSRLIARMMSSDEEVPLLTVGDQKTVFQAIEPDSFQVEIEDVTSGLWQLVQDEETLFSFSVELIPDLPPIVRLAAIPLTTERSALQILAKASDDYGVSNLRAVMRREGHEQILELDLPFPEGQKQGNSQSYHDLTAHLWAGLTVNFFVEATDVIGQKGQTKPLRLTLPERKFTHPVARVLVSERRKLSEDFANNRISVAATLEAVSSLPEAVDHDYGVLMALSVARASLLSRRPAEQLQYAADLLWQAALKLENGDLTLAEKALREAEKALMEALNQGADDAEIAQRVEDLKEAMNRFLDELAKNQDPNQPSPQTGDTGQQLAQQDLNNLLDQLDQLARSGARDAARQLLSQLQNILENIQSAGRQQPNAQMQAGQQALRQLDELLKGQQQLLDDTFRMSEDEARRQAEQQAGADQLPDLQASGKYRSLKERQEALRQMLGDLMGEMGLKGNIPNALGQAERAMNEARQALEQNQSKSAQSAQKQALERLRESAMGLAQQMMQGQGGTGNAGLSGNQRDPLGRPMPNNGAQGREGFEDLLMKGGNASAARAILEEVRRRLSDPNRSDTEKQYLRRLLERFN